MSAGAPAGPDPGAWRAWHLVYHEDRDRLITEMVAPTVGALQASGDVRGFYFVRYNLGGPHVRLRLRPARGRVARVDERVREAAAGFFARSPSARTVPAEAILAQNAGIVATDPHPLGAADTVFEDNSVVEQPVMFEVERYGGPALLAHSLEFFVRSSEHALRFVAALPERGAAGRLADAGALCIQQAWGFAGDGKAFAELLGYAARLFPHELLARFTERGDEAFERQADGYVRLVRGELAALAAAGSALPPLAVASRRLAGRIRRLEAHPRWIVGASQLHMTANRIGLRNPEELYLSRILLRAAQALEARDPGFWREVWRERAPRRRVALAA